MKGWATMLQLLLVSGLVVVTSATVSLAEAVDMQAFEVAMTAALQGPERKRLKIEKHEFNVKPIKITRTGDSILVSGEEGHHISHHRGVVNDDQIYYEFTKQGGIIIGPKVRYEKGGWGPTLKTVMGIVEKANEVYDEIARKQGAIVTAQQAAFEETKKLLDGTWQGEANFLIANIALRVK
jgi:hypothetical protein